MNQKFIKDIEKNKPMLYGIICGILLFLLVLVPISSSILIGFINLEEHQLSTVVGICSDTKSQHTDCITQQQYNDAVDILNSFLKYILPIIHYLLTTMIFILLIIDLILYYKWVKRNC